MKRYAALAAAALILSIVVGCSNTNGQDSSTSIADPVEVPSEQTPDLVELSVSDLNEILAALDPSEAALTYHGQTDSTCDAGSAIRAGSYIKRLQNFTWEECHAPDGWDGSNAHHYVFAAPSMTLTAYHSNPEDGRFLHVATEYGEGMFILPYLTDEESGETKQVSWMIYDTFKQWYDEARTASLCGGAGTALTAEELDWFEGYTASVQTSRSETGGYHSSATEISGFFTSYYDDVADLNFKEFMWYFPGNGDAVPVTDAEFEALKNVDVWPLKEFESLESMPVPIHKYSRSTVDAALAKYAGITTANLDTSSVAYLAEYDSYYNYTSDFGPGYFIPCYGEKSADTVTLWEAPSGESGNSDMLVLKNTGDNWHILSHQPAAIS